MCARRLTVALAAIAALVVALAGSQRVQAQDTQSETIAGTLIGVAKDQRSLDVFYDNTHITGCGISSVTPSVTENATSVAVTLTAQVGVLPPDTTCPAIAIGMTITVPLAMPLAGRDIEGLTLKGGALGVVTIGPRRMPSLLGLSARDARLMLSGGAPSLVGLIVHHASRSATGLPRVIAQRPRAGAALPRRGGVVTLTVARSPRA